MSEIRVAMVGIGGYGGWYLRELLPNASRYNARLVAGIDAFPERSPWMSALQEAGIPIFSSQEDFYRQESADLVVNAAPIHLHAPLTVEALSHGSNVLCEKPLCARLDEADQMAEAERRAGKFVAIGYQWSFSDTIQAIKRDIFAGRFGRPLKMKTLILWPRPLSYYWRNAWAGHVRTAEGAWVYDSPVNNATAHYLHNMLYLLGDSLSTSAWPETIEAQLWRANDIENYDTAFLQVVTTGGVAVQMFTAHPVPNEIGPLATYEFEDAVLEYSLAPRTFRARFRNGQVADYGDPDDTQYNKLWHSVAAVRSGASPACGIETARPHTEVVNRLQNVGVQTFAAEQIVREARGEDTLVWVRGLQEALECAYADGKMPPWGI